MASRFLRSCPMARASFLALPLLLADVTVTIDGELISRPYVEITLNLMQRFGVAVERDAWRSLRVPAGNGYQSPGTLSVEGDASGASYFLAAGVIGGGPVRVAGVGRASIQGDVAFADELARLGADIRFGPDWIEARAGRALRGGTIDCVAIPDAAMTLAVMALFATRPTRLTGIGTPVGRSCIGLPQQKTLHRPACAQRFSAISAKSPRNFVDVS